MALRSLISKASRMFGGGASTPTRNRPVKPTGGPRRSSSPKNAAANKAAREVKKAVKKL